jgi:hypothetical protein
MMKNKLPDNLEPVLLTLSAFDNAPAMSNGSA